MNYRARLSNLAQLLAKQKLEGMIVTHPPNIRYLCGFTGSSGILLLSANRHPIFITDGRYTEQASEEVRGAKVVIAKSTPLSVVAQLLSKRNSSRVGIEGEHLTVSAVSRLRKSLPSAVRLKEVSPLIERLRAVKEAPEIELMQRAAIVGADLFSVATKTICAGVEESTVAAEMEYAAKRAGADSMSFETIVAAGPRSALPHGRASTAKIPARGLIVLDFGVILAGYCSDRTRTVHVGKPSAKSKAIYDAVLDSQLAGIDAVRPGVTASEVDHACRSVLRKAKLDRYFTHSTGHGVGLEIHEFPRLAKNQTDVLKPGMVVTVEPGVYLPGIGGVRIEDMVVVTERGNEVLAPSDKDLIQL